MTNPRGNAAIACTMLTLGAFSACGSSSADSILASSSASSGSGGVQTSATTGASTSSTSSSSASSGGAGTSSVSSSSSSGAGGSGGAVAQPARALGAYENASCTCQPNDQGGPEIDAFAAWVGSPIDIGEDFLPTDSTWDNWAAPDWNLTGWKAWKAANAKHRLVLAPSFGPTTDMTGGAAGTYDADWKNLGQRLADAGLVDTIFRIAHEFSGNWYWYTPAGREQQFIDYWKHAVAALRSVPGQKFQFFWNPALGVSTQNGAPFDAEKAYPGDDVVDYIGPDVYDSDYGAYPTAGPITQSMQDAAWKNMTTGDHGLDWYATFAAQHNKPLAIGEWGVWDISTHHGGGDDPSFIQNMHDWIGAHDVGFHIYFDVTAGDGDHQLWPTTNFPKSAALFQTLF